MQSLAFHFTDGCRWAADHRDYVMLCYLSVLKGLISYTDFTDLISVKTSTRDANRQQYVI